MKYLFIKLGIYIFNIIYFFLKMLPSKDKITLISRQSNNITLDFKLLNEEILANKKYKTVILCKKLDTNNIKNIVLYFFHMFRQIYHLATSKIVVLDSYCMCASFLKHKKDLKIIQMWHSVGTMKKFGYEILNMDEGSNEKLAKTMKMHKNYDVILCAGEGYQCDLCRGFNYTEDKIRIIPLPRVDLLTNKKYIEETKKKIYGKYNLLNKKENILYVPTFRKDEKEFTKYINKLIESIDYTKYNLIIKLHPLSKTIIDNPSVIVDKDFSSLEMLCVSDHVITDYSCILYEAGIMNKPLYFYSFDYSKYIEKRNINIDYKKELPGVISNNPKKIIDSIESKEYDYDKLHTFINKYIDTNRKNCTKRIYKLICELDNKK